MNDAIIKSAKRGGSMDSNKPDGIDINGNNILPLLFIPF